MKTSAENDSDIRRIIIWGSSLGVGVGAASLEALRPHCTFQFSATTLLAFAVGLFGLRAYWQLVFRENPSGLWRFLRGIASAFVVLAGVMAFLYPLRYVAAEKYPELAIGLAAAVIALSVVAAFLLACKRFFEADGAEPPKP